MNTKPKKPEKKSWKEQSNCWDKISGIQICQEEGYNEACDDWNKYHEWDKAQNYIPKDRVSVERILGIIYEKYPPYEIAPYPDKTDTENKAIAQMDKIKKEELATELSKELRGEK